jgi:hypothetical protein
VLPIDWPRFLSRLPQGVDADFFAGLSASTSTPARPAASPGATRATQWRALAQSQRRDAVLAHLREQALQVLGLGTSTMLEARMPLKEAGLDSLMAVELRNALTRSIGQSLPATLLFDHPSLDALATYLMRHLELMPLAAPVPDAAAAALAGLSDAEAEAQLLAELDGAAPRSQS